MKKEKKKKYFRCLERVFIMVLIKQSLSCKGIVNMANQKGSCTALCSIVHFYIFAHPQLPFLILLLISLMRESSAITHGACLTPF